MMTRKSSEFVPSCRRPTPVRIMAPATTGAPMPAKHFPRRGVTAAAKHDDHAHHE